MIEILTAELQDALEMRALFLDAFSPAASRLGYRPSPMDRPFSSALSNAFVLKALIDDDRPLRAAGYAVVSPSVGWLYVDAIAVDPRRQGRGVGRALLSAVEGLAGELCYRRVELNTDPRLDGAMRFYLAAGYREIPQRRMAEPPSIRLQKSTPSALDRLLGKTTKGASA